MARYATTTQRGLGQPHVKDGRRLRAAMQEGDLCWRCGQPMYSWQALDRDHITPRALGGTDGPAVLAHASCNRSAGGKLRHQLHPETSRPQAPPATCKTCGKPYTRAARICEVCGAHYHPSYGEQRTCGRVCGVELRRQVYGHALRSPDPGLAERRAQRQAQRQRERQAALAAKDERAAHRAQQIRELRAAGLRWADIATAVGMAGPGAAHNASDPVKYRNYQRARAQVDGQPLTGRW